MKAHFCQTLSLKTCNYMSQYLYFSFETPDVHGNYPGWVLTSEKPSWPHLVLSREQIWSNTNAESNDMVDIALKNGEIVSVRLLEDGDKPCGLSFKLGDFFRTQAGELPTLPLETE